MIYVAVQTPIRLKIGIVSSYPTNLLARDFIRD